MVRIGVLGPPPPTQGNLVLNTVKQLLRHSGAANAIFLERHEIFVQHFLHNFIHYLQNYNVYKSYMEVRDPCDPLCTRPWYTYILNKYIHHYFPNWWCKFHDATYIPGLYNIHGILTTLGPRQLHHQIKVTPVKMTKTNMQSARQGKHLHINNKVYLTDRFHRN